MPTEPWDEFSERLRDLETAEFAPDIISPFLALPGLRAFYPMSAVGTAGEARDMGSSGATYDLTNNNVAIFNYDGLVPYCGYDGVNQYHSFIDNANFDILGTEVYIAAAANGLTIGGWFYYDTLVAAAQLIGKMDIVGPSLSYRLAIDGTPRTYLQISNNGAAFTHGVNGLDAYTTTLAWHFVVGRFIPSTELKLWVDDNIVTTAVAPAAIWNSTADFTIGAADAAGNPFDGRASLCFLCTTALSDGIIDSLFQQTRGAFGI